ncbi:MULTISPECIES: hypothetical protein [Microvirga]|uniref:Uncharacterized protein n=2 Tax=Microvirga TaxID=186650 RepID=A0ABW9Z446_9HYPH|nr:hypothetical protein [Microvirga arsenatis]NBJ13861.1 hypothetical protein [Microvirga arsenatis]NBJ27322.1 hypothetical protein [Microvirga arsenatis]
MSAALPQLITAVTLSCAATALTWSSVQAAEADFFERFRGTWSGSGKVRREGASQLRQVTCSVTGAPAENRISALGSCRAVVIFSHPIGVDLVHDPRSGTYPGTYTGSQIGPARLSGTRKGDAVNLRIEWPRPVNGDIQAAMVIRNDGRGRPRIMVAENLTPGGPVQQTTEIVLARQ